MRRRTIFGGALGAVAWSRSIAWAQPAAGARRLGVLLPFRSDDSIGQTRADDLRRGLAAHGWQEGRNLLIDWRWGAGDAALFERHAIELVALAPDVLVAQSSPSARALQRHTNKIPIVFSIVTDPVGQHLVDSLTRPGGNITGFSDFDAPMAGKWVEMLSQIAPPVSKATVIFNPSAASFAGLMIQPIADAAKAFSIAIESVPVNDDAEIERAISAHAKEHGRGVIVLPDIFSFVHRDTIVGAANQGELPAIYWHRAFVASGGLMSYGVDSGEMVRRSADYVDRILRGARPADLPVQQPVKFSMIVNLRTARAIGLEVPPTLLAGANEVIE